MFKKYIIFLLLGFTILSCGTDYMLSSFYIRNNDLKWALSPSQQTNLDYYAHIVGNSKINEYNSPVIIATPDNYILSIYEYRNDPQSTVENIIGINGEKRVNIKIAISKDAQSFNTKLDVGNVAYIPSESHGSPIGFIDKDGNVIVLAVEGIGFGAETGADKITPIGISISTNDGYKWTDWTNIVNTNTFKPLLDKGYNRFYTTSGKGITLRNNTLVCMIDYKKHTTSGYNPEGAAILYSKNNGQDWQIGATMEYKGAASGKRFAKIIAERSDGKLLIAAVHNTLNDYNAKNSLYWGLADSLEGNITDFPVTGLPDNSGGNISGDKISFSKGGLSMNGIVLVHSTPNREFINDNGQPQIVENAMAISISEDEGQTWTLLKDTFGDPPNKTTFKQDLKVLKDGSIIICSEEGNELAITQYRLFNIVFRRTSLYFLSDGKYVYEGI
ncbi:sialidase family protein [Brachyspira pilosicoli]|uniref:sialidase family protein n=1 Tax=Brachyspira pilosicoli TaxID=52584 RepID=UPI003006B9D7